VNSRRRKNVEEEMNFKEFSERLRELNLEIDAVDLEILFAVVDTDNSGLLSQEEILTAFKKFDSDKQLNLNSFRKAIYKHITGKAITLQEFYDQFDTRGYGKISMPAFTDMLTTL
jgi:Ca2+-binding EF-hand superfamily protein